MALNLTVSSLPGQRPVPSLLAPRISEGLDRAEFGLIAFRRDLHQHPDLSNDEARTAGLLADRLRVLGLEVRTGVGGHGVVALLRGGHPGPMVAYRADMDAFPSSAPDPVAFPSLIPGVRHICGHDLHATIGLAIATGLAGVRADLRGSVMFIFQPAEEVATGADAMLADGVFGADRPVAIYAVHTAPMQVGHLATAPGGLMAGRDHLTIALTGTGDLGAASDSVRRILARAATLRPDQRFVPSPPSLVMIETFADRAIPGGTQIGAEISIASAETRRALRARLEGEFGRMEIAGVQVHFTYQEKVIAGVTNDPALVAQGNAAIAGELGDSVVQTVTTVLPAFSEDFGSFQDRVPGVMYFLGVSNAARGTVGMPHSPDYVADEGAILIGARAMTSVLLARLQAGSEASSGR